MTSLHGFKKWINSHLNDLSHGFLHILRMSRQGVVIAEMICLRDKRSVLERKRVIRHLPQYQHVFIKASKSHTEQVIDANFNMILNEMKCLKAKQLNDVYQSSDYLYIYTYIVLTYYANYIIITIGKSLTFILWCSVLDCMLYEIIHVSSIYYSIMLYFLYYFFTYIVFTYRVNDAQGYMLYNNYMHPLVHDIKNNLYRILYLNLLHVYSNGMRNTYLRYIIFPLYNCVSPPCRESTLYDSQSTMFKKRKIFLMKQKLWSR